MNKEYGGEREEVVGVIENEVMSKTLMKKGNFYRLEKSTPKTMSKKKLEWRCFDAKKRRMEEGKTICAIRHFNSGCDEVEKDQKSRF